MLGFLMDLSTLLEGSDVELAVPPSFVTILSTLSYKDPMVRCWSVFLDEVETHLVGVTRPSLNVPGA
jgi:hypothetical protein